MNQLPPRIDFFHAEIDPWTMDQTVECIDAAIKARKRVRHVCINVAKLVSMQNDLEMRANINSSDIISADGYGIVLGARLLKKKIPERVTGIDLMHNLLALAEQKNYRPFLLGAKPDVLERTIVNIKSKYPKIEFAGHHHGYFWEFENDLVEKIASSGADMLFVAISSPKKEQFLFRNKQKLSIPFIMGVGGSFDVVAGVVKRCPKWLQNIGMEWFFRFIQEPGRMWRRVLNTNFRFGIMLLKSFLSF